MPSGINKLVLKTFATLSLGLCSSFAISTEKPSSAISAEKQEELNKLIAEAVKQAGIELDEEELTIVIVKKPGDEADSDNEEGQIIGEITTKGSSEQVVKTTETEATTENSNDKTVAKQSVETKKESDTASSAQTKHQEDNLDTEAQLAEKQSENSEKDKAVAIIPAAVPAASQQNANNIGVESNTVTTATESSPITEPLQDKTNNTAPKKLDTKQELAISPNEQFKANEPTADSQPTLETATEEELAKEGITATPKEIEETAVLQQQEIEKAQQTTVPAIKAANTQQPNINSLKHEDYYGKYIAPEARMDSYYSSDIMEAINKAHTIEDMNSLTIPHEQISKLSIPAMASDEMSSLVVEGALDATAAGGVSTTTLKSALVIPDISALEELEEKIDDEEQLEEIKKALNKKDLDRRVKEALELLSQNQNRGSSSGRASAGTMTATDVRVTATVTSRKTPEAITTFPQTNLRNSNF